MKPFYTKTIIVIFLVLLGINFYIKEQKELIYIKNEEARKEAEQRAYANKKQKEREEAEQRRRDAQNARIAADNQRRYDRSGNKGGSLQCNRVSGDYGLWRYCESGSCDGLSSNYGLWRLCQNNETSGLSGNYGIWSYLENGNLSAFRGNAYFGAKQNSGSFADRKRFVIYYMRGYVYRSY